MMKFCSCSAKSAIKVYKAGYQNDTINMLRATSFSSVNHNPKDIHSNKVDAPFVTTEPNEEAHQKKSSEEDQSMTEEATDFVADKAKSGTKVAVETAFNVGRDMAEGMEQTFGAIKDTTKKVKDSVLGEFDDEPGHHEKVDKYVHDLRRKAGGYDQTSR